MKSTQKPDKKALLIMLGCIFLVIVGLVAYQLLHKPEPIPFFSKEPQVSTEIPVQEDNRIVKTDILYPVGYLVVSDSRKMYVEGSMRLVVPRLELDLPVLDGTDLPRLEHGVGLYDNGQPPEEGINSNTSIAGHRDLYGFEFYYLDTVSEGDRLYLVYHDKLFVYEYMYTEIVEATDWNPIRNHPDCRLTLTTCDPIGTSLRRMIVTAQIIEVHEYTEEFVLQ